MSPSSLSTVMEGSTVSACSAITKTRSAWKDVACTQFFSFSLSVQPAADSCELAWNEAGILHSSCTQFTPGSRLWEGHYNHTVGISRECVIDKILSVGECVCAAA